MDPFIAPEGYNVTIYGDLFTPNTVDPLIFLLQNSTDEWVMDVLQSSGPGTPAVTDSAGNFTAWWIVPRLDDGDYIINATDAEGISAQTEFSLIERISYIVEPSPDLGSVPIGSSVELGFGVIFSDVDQSTGIILVDYSDVGFSYSGFTAEMDGINATDQFDAKNEVGSLFLNCSSIQPANGELVISIFFEAESVPSNYSFDWLYVYIGYQEPPGPPATFIGEGETLTEILGNSDPSVIWIRANSGGVRLDPGGEVSSGSIVRFYTRVSDIETISQELTVTISYRPQGDAWTTEVASCNVAWDYWYIDWVIPGDAVPGLYDVKVDVEDPHGGSGTLTETGEFTVI